MIEDYLFLAASSGDDDSPMFWLLGPISAVAFYSMIYLRYRNTNKRHAYEFKTHSEIGEVTGSDTKVGEVKGQENSSITGANASSPRLRLGAASIYTETWREGQA